jgi:hypothetical protein
MSKHETWRTRKYWQSVGGLLIEEFIAVKGTKEQGVRSVDGLIVLGEETKIYEGNTYDITGKDVIVIQTKKQRIGMYLLGQAYFSKLLIEKHNPKSVKSVAICGKNDTVMQELADKHYLEVIVITEKEKYV